MKKLFLLAFLAHLMSSCSQQSPSMSSSAMNNAISTSDHKALLQKQEAEAQKDSVVEASSLIAVAQPGQFLTLNDEIKSLGGKIIFADDKTGYINFELSSTSTLKLLDSGVFEQLAIDKEQVVDLKLNVTKDPNGEVKGAISRTATPKDLYPTHLMKVDQLRDEFKKDYDQTLDGSSSTVVIADTGLDISRTDVFQDRIVELHTLRKSDHALLFDAELINEDGKEYYSATYQGVTVKIEKSKKLEGATEAYVGFFTEGQFQNPRGYNNYDFNQDGQAKGIFPVIVVRKDNSPYQAYINVNSSLMYGPTYGDDSIEDENLLMDFNWVAKNLKDRYVENKSNPLKSYYKYTTRTDIIGNNTLLNDRNKGTMNIAVTLGLGNELDAQGNLRAVSKLPDGSNVYMMGLTGFDIMGHGTHCAGIAAGRFDTAKEFNSPAPNAKVIGVTYLGAAVSNGAFFNLIHQISQNNKNPVFSFSFGGNTPMNDTHNENAKLFDKVAQMYNTIFVKAAGNEGPALNTHGITISKNMIAVANYYSTESRATYSYGNFADSKFLLETSSSRGPMIDGALKPDIGAPGWVMSSVPLARALGSSKNGSFQYWPGTSMATPNVAGVVALLYDAMEKSGHGNQQGPAVSVDKVQRALWNSALPYDELRYGECIAKQDGSLATNCTIKEKGHKYQWVEGGAGRVNALGAWNVLQKIMDEAPQYYTVSTKSVLNNYRGEAAGYFNIIKDEIPKNIDFKIAIDPINGGEDLDSLAMHEKVRLEIPADVDWLSFDVNSSQKERLLDIFGGESASLRVHVNRQKLMKNGRIKAGIHSAVIKAYGVDGKDVFKFVVPVTMVGYHTLFDANLDNYQLSAKGFVQGGQFARYFIPVKSENEAVIIDLGVDGSMPGDLSLAVFHDGMKITENPMWTLSNPYYGAGRNNTHFVLKGKPGLYEIILKSDAGADFTFKDLTGSFYNLTVSRMVLDVNSIEQTKSGKSVQVSLNGVSNPGGTVRIAQAGVALRKMKTSGTIEVGHQETATVELDLESDFAGLEIATAYLGSVAKVDVDLQLVDANGQVVAESGNPDSTEQMAKKIPAGKYTLKVFGYNVPGGEKVTIDYDVAKVLTKPLVLANSFKGPNGLEVAAGKRIYHNQEFDASATFSMEAVSKAADLEGYTPVLSVEVLGNTSNNASDVSVILSREI